MLNFLRNKQKDEPTPFKTLFFKEVGTQPFKDIEFSKIDVFQINDFTLRNFDETANIYKELVNSPSYFEVWIVPTFINPNLLKLNSFRDKKNPQLQVYLDNINKLAEKIFDDDVKVNNSYLVVNKENSEIVTEKFKKLSFSLRDVSSDEAKSVSVLNKTAVI